MQRLRPRWNWICWLGREPRLYGDTMLFAVSGKRGAAIEVHPDVLQFGPMIAAIGENHN